MDRFADAFRALAGLEWPTDWSHLPRALGGHALVVALTAAYAASLWGTGRGFARWLGISRGDPGPAGGALPPVPPSCGADAAILEFLLGAGLAGTLVFGLALPRLWFPSLLHALVAAGLLLAAPGLPALARLLRPAPLSMRGAWVVLPVVAVVFPLALLPETDMDSLLYHLSVPQHFLGAHGLFHDRISHAFKLPLLGEMLYAWPVALGFDQVARLLNLVAVGAASAAFLSMLGSSTPAAWTALAALLSSFYLFFLMTAAKNDVLAFSFAVAGLLAVDLASRGGECRPGARSRKALTHAAWLLVGCAVAAKYTYGAMAVAVAAWGPVRRGESWRSAARNALAGWVMLLPVAPWYAKSWLMFGNPVYFWMTSVFPTVGWSRESMRTWTRRMVEPYAAPGAADAVGTLARIPWRLLSFAPALLLGAAGVFLPGAGAVALRVAALGTATAWVAIYFGRIERYATTSDFVVALAAGFALMALSGTRRGRILRGAVLALCLFPLASMVPHAVNRFPMRYLAGQEDEDAYLLARFGPLYETQDWVNRNLKPRRLLVDGEWRTYRFRCPIAGTLTMGHPPVVWEAVKESATTADVARRLRQLGISHIACNFITGVYQSAVNEAFRWDRRMLVLCRDFTRDWLEVIRAPTTVDHSGGGFYVYRVLPRPAKRRAYVFFLPGAMGALYEAREQERLGSVPKAFAAMYRLMNTVPDVGQYRNIIGYYWWLLGRHDTAYRLFKEPARAGMVDDQNWYCFGVSAMALRRYDEAEAALKRSLEVYPMRRLDTLGQMATNYFRWGSVLYDHDALDRAEQVLALSYGCLVEAGMRQRCDHESAAMVLLMRAKALARMGRKAEARAEMKRAVGVLPDVVKYEDFRETSALIDGAPRPRR